jgi:hypothetical protein
MLYPAGLSSISLVKHSSEGVTQKSEILQIKLENLYHLTLQWINYRGFGSIAPWFAIVKQSFTPTFRCGVAACGARTATTDDPARLCEAVGLLFNLFMIP